jgi:hypothetical protein
MARHFYSLEARINHRIFDLAKKLFGLTNGRKRKGHNQRCILPGCDGDNFHFDPRKRTFHCPKCGFRGKIISLTEKVLGISYAEAFDTIAEVAECQELIPEKSQCGISHISETTSAVFEMVQEPPQNREQETPIKGQTAYPNPERKLFP